MELISVHAHTHRHESVRQGRRLKQRGRSEGAKSGGSRLRVLQRAQAPPTVNTLGRKGERGE